jgi:hypothetical protein
MAAKIADKDADDDTAPLDVGDETAEILASNETAG